MNKERLSNMLMSTDIKLINTEKAIDPPDEKTMQADPRTRSKSRQRGIRERAYRGDATENDCFRPRRIASNNFQIHPVDTQAIRGSRPT